jgi:hypothetical protein
MPGSRGREDQTAPFEKSIVGNDLFDRVVEVADPALVPILISTLELVGSSPEQMTHQQLGEVLPEVERRLRLVADPDSAQRTIARAKKILLGWD